MIYISVQPDEPFFLWQINLFVYNFRRLGVLSEKIHVLISYNPQKGLSPEFKNLIEKDKNAHYYAYPDNRESKLYFSSFRPKIIAQHIRSNPQLSFKTIFYHDSDIILTKSPKIFESLLEDNINYASNTDNYTGTDYIIQNAGEQGFLEMCKTINVSPEKIKKNSTAGGAQYILKNLDADFWERLYINCEKLYAFLCDLNGKLLKNFNSHLQAWCTDMWCIWWMLLDEDKIAKTSPILDFSWINEPKKNKNIIHYTGVFNLDDSRYFVKYKYIMSPPYNDDFSKISQDSVSFDIVKEIDNYRKTIVKNDKIDFADLSILIPLRVDCEERIDNLRIVCNFLLKHFDVKIIILEADSYPKISPNTLPKEIDYHFYFDSTPQLHRTHYLNLLIMLSKTPYISIYDVDVIVPIKQMEETMNSLREKKYSMVYPFDGLFLNLSGTLKKYFSLLLDDYFLLENIKKIDIVSKRAFGGCIFFNKEHYKNAGGENENFKTWGPEDLERFKRMQSLNYSIKRINGAIYHLDHPRTYSSSYGSVENHINSFDEYFRICGMKKEQLEKYINTWPWKTNL